MLNHPGAYVCLSGKNNTSRMKFPDFGIYMVLSSLSLFQVFNLEYSINVQKYVYVFMYKRLKHEERHTKRYPCKESCKATEIDQTGRRCAMCWTSGCQTLHLRGMKTELVEVGLADGEAVTSRKPDGQKSKESCSLGLRRTTVTGLLGYHAGTDRDPRVSETEARSEQMSLVLKDGSRGK